MATNKRPDHHVLEALYIRWLQGDSLRQIASGLPEKTSHSTLCTWFNQAFGGHCTDPTAMSLARSLVADYQDSSQVDIIKLALSLLETPETNKHRSEHSLQQLTNYQAARTDTILDFIAVDPRDPWGCLEVEPVWGFLRLPLVNYWVDTLVGTLEAFKLAASIDHPQTAIVYTLEECLKLSPEDTVEVTFAQVEDIFRTLANLPPKEII